MSCARSWSGSGDPRDPPSGPGDPVPAPGIRANLQAVADAFLDFSECRRYRRSRRPEGCGHVVAHVGQHSNGAKPLADWEDILRISRLRIKNFRSIQELDVQLPQVCAVVGPNNAGKSNILGGIRRALGASWLSVNDFGEDDIYYRDPDRDIEIWCTVEPPVPYQKFQGGASHRHSHAVFPIHEVQDRRTERPATSGAEMPRP